MLIMSKKNNNVIMNHRGRPVKGVNVSLDNLATFDHHSILELLAYCNGTFIKVVILDPEPLSPLIRLKIFPQIIKVSEMFNSPQDIFRGTWRTKWLAGPC